MQGRVPLHCVRIFFTGSTNRPRARRCRTGRAAQDPLYPDEAALVMKALDAAGEASRAERKKQRPVEIDEDVSAETSKAPPEPPRPTRADALQLVAESFLSSGPAAGAGGDRHQILVHLEDHLDPVFPIVRSYLQRGGAALEPHRLTVRVRQEALLRALGAVSLGRADLEVRCTPVRESAFLLGRPLLRPV